MENNCDCLLRRTDRLSNLPDSVLYHILSFLETKDAIQTSVLSRRWRSAWKHVPTLNIRSKSFREYASFKICLDKILSLRYPLSLRKVTLFDRGIAEDRDGCLFARLIKYAFSHDAKHLFIDMTNNVLWEDDTEYYFSGLFDTVSDCSLETLTLVTVFIDFEIQSSGFRMLTKLELLRCMFLSDGEGLVDPFSKFPCLEHLVLLTTLPENLQGDGKRLRISGHRLLSLSITESYFRKLEIHAPKLEYFYYQSFEEHVEFKELNLPSLDHAVIWIYNECCCDGNPEHGIHCWMSLLHGLSNARTLKLCHSTIELLSGISEFLEKQQSPFTRLETLSLEELEVHEAPAVIDYFVKGASSGTKPVVKFE